MTEPVAVSATAVTLRRDIPAAPAAVYRAWTDAAQIAQWLCPNPAMTVRARADATPGGRYEIVMQPPEGDPFIVGGEYETVEPPHRLVFTWRWAGSDDTSRVSVTLLPSADGATELTLTHEKLPNREEVDSHTWGWQACLDRLTALESLTLA